MILRFKLRVVAVAFLIIALTTFCEKDPAVEKPITELSAYERSIRDKYDNRAVFKWSDYITLLEKLSNDKFIVLPLNEMRNTFNSEKVVIGLRHDVDMNPFKALEMAKIEKLHGIRSTYFFLATADYYGSFNKSVLNRSPEIGKLIKEIYNTGSEIGIHNDLLSVMIQYKIDPFEFCKEEINFYRSLRIRIYGTASHGSYITKNLKPNYNIFSDYAVTDSVEYNGLKYPIGLHSLKEFGFEYEAYKIPYNIYFSDSGGKWSDPEGLAGIIRKIESCTPGDRIQILIHPDWWGVK